MGKKASKKSESEKPNRIQFTRKKSDSDARLRQADRLARPLLLLKLLVESKRWTKDALAVELECSTKTVDRTLKVLELAGIPVIQDAKSRTWRIQDNCLIPPVKLSAEEFLDEARYSAIAKTQTNSKTTTAVGPRTAKAVIPENVKSIVATASSLTSVLELKSVDHTHSTEALRTIQLALATGQQLEAEYFSPYNDSTSRISIHPYRLCFIRSAWYLIGRPNYAETAQVFRVVRFRSMRRLSLPAIVPEDFSLEKFLGNAWGVFRGAPTYDVAIRFSGSAASVVAETKWHRTQIAETNTDGTVTLRFTVDGLDEVLWWLMSWAPFARVEKPEELRKRLVEELSNGIKANL